MRGTFANIRLRNLLTPDAEGNVTEHLPSGERMSIFDASRRYRDEGTPLVLRRPDSPQARAFVDLAGAVKRRVDELGPLSSLPTVR